MRTMIHFKRDSDPRPQRSSDQGLRHRQRGPGTGRPGAHPIQSPIKFVSGYYTLGLKLTTDYLVPNLRNFSPVSLRCLVQCYLQLEQNGEYEVA
jgi:hypothetical protein